MQLFWIVHHVDNDRLVAIVEATSLVHARLRAVMADLGGTFAEGHSLDDATTNKIPKTMIGRVLSQREAEGLLKKMG